jgi:hypothetical protein
VEGLRISTNLRNSTPVIQQEQGIVFHKPLHWFDFSIPPRHGTDPAKYPTNPALKRLLAGNDDGDRVPIMKTKSGRAEISGKRIWRIRCGYAPWMSAAFIGAAVPFLLYFLYVLFPAARPWIALGQDGPIEPGYWDDGRVKLPVLGFPLVGSYMSFPVSTMLIYGIAGILLSVRRNSPPETEPGPFPAHLVPAVSLLLATVPALSVAWVLNLKAGRFPDFPWEIFGAGEGPAETGFVFRKIVGFSLLFPQLSAALSVMSLVITPTRVAVINGGIAVAAFFGLALLVNALGG